MIDDKEKLEEKEEFSDSSFDNSLSSSLLVSKFKSILFSVTIVFFLFKVFRFFFFFVEIGSC
jgi:hypothetical protein